MVLMAMTVIVTMVMKTIVLPVAKKEESISQTRVAGNMSTNFVKIFRKKLSQTSTCGSAATIARVHH